MGELRKLRLGNAENVVTPYTAGDETIIIDETTRQIKVNPEEIATQDDLSDVKEDLNQLPTDETGQEWLEEEELRTLYEGAFLDTLDCIFTNLPQDETMGEIVHELETENSWLDQLYREVAASMA